jgi:hypothetical protein
MAAAGISGGSPPSIRAAAIAGRLVTPMYTTMVPPLLASACQSNWDALFSGSSWPVTKVTAVDRPRWVTGMPA